MGTTIGRVDFLVDFDGKKLPAQARKIGREVGEEAGGAATERFNNRFSKIGQEIAGDLRKTGTLSGIRISDAMENAIESRLSGIAAKIADAFLTPEGLDDFAADFERVDDAARELRGGLQELYDAGSLNEEMWGRFGGTLNQWLGKARESERETDVYRDALRDLRFELDQQETTHLRVSQAFDKFNASLEKNEDQAEKTGKANKNLGKNISTEGKQIIAIIAAIAAGGQDIAVLGSAAGAGLTILGAGAVTAGVGLGVLIAGFKGISENLTDIRELGTLLKEAEPDDTQLKRIAELQEITAGFDPSVAAVARLGGAFQDLQDDIQQSLFEGLGPSLDQLTKVLLPTLSDGLNGVATAFNEAVRPLIDELTSPATQEQLAGIFGGIIDQIPLLVGAIGNIGGAIGGVLTGSEPYVLSFFEGLERVTGEFEEFINSLEGQNQLAEWLDNGTLILGEMFDLVGGLSDLLANLVTPASVARTAKFIENLTDSLPFFEKIFSTLGELDAFGVIASILDDVGNALVPILDLLEPLLSIIGNLILTGVKPLAVALEAVGILLSPLKFALEIVGQAVDGVTKYLLPLFENFQMIVGVVQEILDNAFAQLQPALDNLGQTILDLLPSPEALVQILNDEVIPALDDFALWINDIAVPAIQYMIDNIAAFLRDFDFAQAIKDFKTFVDVVRTYADLFYTAITQGPIAVILKLLGLMEQFNNLKLQPKVAEISGIGRGDFSENARGGIFDKRTLGYFGEDGSEAIVPLNRPLSDVDPSVRWLSAIAQGKSAPSSSGDGGGTIVEAGAIVIMARADQSEAEVAEAALDEVIKKL